MGGKNVRKKYISPELEILETLLTTDVLYASTGEDNVDDIGGTLPPSDGDIPDLGDISDPTYSGEDPVKGAGGSDDGGGSVGDDWDPWW